MYIKYLYPIPIYNVHKQYYMSSACTQYYILYIVDVYPIASSDKLAATPLRMCILFDYVHLWVHIIILIKRDCLQ